MAAETYQEIELQFDIESEQIEITTPPRVQFVGTIKCNDYPVINFVAYPRTFPRPGERDPTGIEVIIQSPPWAKHGWLGHEDHQQLVKEVREHICALETLQHSKVEQGSEVAPKKRISKKAIFLTLVVAAGTALVGNFIIKKIKVKKLKSDPPS